MCQSPGVSVEDYPEEVLVWPVHIPRSGRSRPQMGAPACGSLEVLAFRK